MASRTEYIQNTAKSYADAFAASMNSFANNAIQSFSSLSSSLKLDSAPNINLGSPGLVDVTGAPTSIQRTPITASAPNSVSIPPSVNFQDPGSIPTFTLVAPILNLPSTPDVTIPSAPTSAPTFTEPLMPDAPTFKLPDPPSIRNLDIPYAPTINLPTFSATLVDLDIQPPTNTFAWSEPVYKDALLDELKAKLLKDLSDGGYGIEPQDEQPLWERARERELIDAQRMVREASRALAAKNWSYPTGAIAAVEARARQEALAKVSSINRDVALKRADMYVDNRKFTIQQVRELEQMLITYWGYMMERSLNAAKMTVELAVQVYNSMLAKANYNLERYRAQASVFDVQLRAALSSLEAYKVQLEGVRISADIQKIHVDVYNSQLQGITALAGIYRTQMEGAQIYAQVQNLKFQAFDSSVRAFVSQVQAKSAQFDMYRSQIQGELSKVEAYKAQSEAYQSQVGAYAATVNASKVRLEGQLEPLKLQLEKYRVDISKYQAELQASQASVQQAVELHNADVRVYGMQGDLRLKQAEINLGHSKAQAEIFLAQAKMNADKVIGTYNALLASSQAVASVNKDLASAYGAFGAAGLSSAVGLEANIMAAQA